MFSSEELGVDWDYSLGALRCERCDALSASTLSRGTAGLAGPGRIPAFHRARWSTLLADSLVTGWSWQQDAQEGRHWVSWWRGGGGGGCWGLELELRNIWGSERQKIFKHCLKNWNSLLFLGRKLNHDFIKPGILNATVALCLTLSSPSSPKTLIISIIWPPPPVTSLSSLTCISV